MPRPLLLSFLPLPTITYTSKFLLGICFLKFMDTVVSIGAQSVCCHCANGSDRSALQSETAKGKSEASAALNCNAEPLP